MRIDLEAVCRQPIPGDTPTGIDAKYEPEYVAVMEEIEKLSSLTQTAPSWENLVEQAQIVLTRKSKDIVIACYLAYALQMLDGAAGLAEGVSMLKGLFSSFWDDAFPPARKIRRRVNVYDWWHERAYAALEAGLAMQDPLPGEVWKNLQDALSDLDSLAGDAMADANTLLDLKELARRVPVLPEPEPAKPDVLTPEVTPEQDKASAVQPEASEVGEPVSEVSVQAQETLPEPDSDFPPEPLPESRPDQPRHEESAAASPAQTMRSAAVSDSMVPLAACAQVPVDLPEYPSLTPLSEEGVKARNVYVDAVTGYVFIALKENPQDPLARQILRHALWSGVVSLPYAEDGQTRIMPPDEDRASALWQLMDSGKFESLLSGAEDMFAASIFWLDAQYMVAQSLHGLGESYAYAHNVVCEETHRFVKRLPGIENLVFNDGTPFASERTRAWLGEIAMQAVPAVAPAAICQPGLSGSSDSALADSVRRAEELLAAGQVASALMEIETCFCNGFADRLDIRIEQLKILNRTSEKIMAETMALALMEEMGKRGSAEWDAEKTAKALLVVRQAFDRSGNKEKACLAQERIISIRPALAVGWIK